MTEQQGILMQQKFDLQELICPALVKRNRYKIKSDQGWNSDNAQSFEESPFENAPRLFSAKEESDTCERICCKQWRGFSMYVRPGENMDDGPHMYHFQRPFKCTMLCCCTLINPQELSVLDANNAQVGQVLQDWRCAEACMCKRYWKVNDAGNTTQYVIKQDLCENSNCFAPSLCCPVHTIHILDQQEQPTGGFIRNIFPGCNCKGMQGAMRDSYHLKFPPNATAQQRALLLGGLFLIEYQLFEANPNDNNN